MKKSFVIALFVGLSFLAFSCAEPAAEETTDSVIKAGDMVFHATLSDPQTKTELYQDGDALKIYWAPGDKITVFYKGVETLAKNGGSNGFEAQLSSLSPTTDFRGTLPNVSTSASTDPYYYAIYPYRGTGNYYLVDDNDIPTLKPQVNSTQSPAVENGVATNSVMVHVGRSDNTSIPMYNVGSLFRFKITARDDIRKVEFRGKKSEKICGAFTVQFDEDGKPVNISAGAKTVINLTKSSDMGTSFVKDTWYYISLLPTKFTKGVSVTLYTPTMKGIRNIQAVTFERNHCRGAASIDEAVEFAPAITTNLLLNNVEGVTETTLWPHGTASLSYTLTGPINNALTLEDLGLANSDVQWSSDDTDVATVSDGVVTGMAAGNATITVKGIKDEVEWFSGSFTVTVTEAASQLVAKPFIVDESGTTVNFATGNLYTPDGGTTYAFHTFQGQVYSTEENWSVDGQRDLLQWSEIATREPDTADGTDIPTVFNSVWRALTFDQWEYIINTRTANTLNSVENARYAKATVNGISGLLLFPDEYEHPSGVSLPNEKSINKTNCAFSLNYYSETDWEKLEKAGVVFLPLGGHRTGSTWNYDGRYWSCSTRNFESKTGGRLQVSEGYCRVTSNAKTDYMSVRLIRFVTE